MKRFVAMSIAIVAAVSIVAATVKQSRAWNAALATQDEVLALSGRGQRAEAAALGHRYFDKQGREASNLDECILLTTIASVEQMMGANAAGLQTLDTFDLRCRSKSDGKYQYHIEVADGLRRVLKGESPSVRDSVHDS